ncbi:MAG: hypothetical protein J1F01_04565 [Oscillospiraceae bacterium]|nr:hypothetical protein [Oscillospiraceae bacterium]
MEAIFLQILNMSITGSYIILAVMILRLFLKKLPKKYSYLIWSVCAFRLCCPMSFRNIFSIFNLKFFNMPANSGASLEHIPQNIGLMPSPQISTGLNYMDGIVNSSLPAPSNVAASVNPMQIIIFIAAVIWLAGIAALLLYSIISYIILHIKLRNAVIYKKNVYQSDKINSPFVFGLINPKIYIPFGIAENEMRYVLAHERYHIKRRDYIIKPIAFLILVIHWFNPLCWIAFMLMSYDMEMSCDEKVLSSGKAMSKEYSTSLLSFAAGKRPPAPCPLAFVETGIRGRIKNILKYKKPKIYVSVISTILCVAAIVACASNPKSDGYDISYDNLKMSDEALNVFCEKMVGSIMADIDYADSEQIIFHYGNAVFVYNHKTANMEKCFDLNNLDCAHFQQGDYGAHIIVSTDGKEALLVNYGSNDDIKDFKNYIINLENGSAKETNKTELSNPFSSLSETYTTVPDSKGWTSVRCAVENDNVWYLTCESSSIGDMKLCLYRLGETVWDNYIFDNKAKIRQDAIHAALPEGAEIIVSSGSWDIEIDREYYHSREFEKMISSMGWEKLPYAGYNPYDFRIDDFMRAMGVSREQYENKKLNVVMYDVTRTADQFSHPYLFIFDSGDNLIASLDLETQGMGETVKRIFIEIEKRYETLQAQWILFSPQDIYDLSDAQLIVGKKAYSLLDKSNLGEIEKMLSNAEEIKFGTGCPFKAVLKMTRTDGIIGMVSIASDSCAVYKSNGVYYDYSDGDNSRLLSMFGIDSYNYIE